MAKGNFECLNCGEKLKEAAVNVDDIGYFKCCPGCESTSDLGGDEYITSLDIEDITSMGEYLDLPPTQDLVLKSNAELAKIPAFQKKIEGCSLSDFLKKDLV